MAARDAFRSSRSLRISSTDLEVERSVLVAEAERRLVMRAGTQWCLGYRALPACVPCCAVWYTRAMAGGAALSLPLSLSLSVSLWAWFPPALCRAVLCPSRLWQRERAARRSNDSFVVGSRSRPAIPHSFIVHSSSRLQDTLGSLFIYRSPAQAPTAYRYECIIHSTIYLSTVEGTVVFSLEST